MREGRTGLYEIEVLKLHRLLSCMPPDQLHHRLVEARIPVTLRRSPEMRGDVSVLPTATGRPARTAGYLCGLVRTGGDAPARGQHDLPRLPGERRDPGGTSDVRAITVAEFGETAFGRIIKDLHTGALVEPRWPFLASSRRSASGAAGPRRYLDWPAAKFVSNGAVRRSGTGILTAAISGLATPAGHTAVPSRSLPR